MANINVNPTRTELLRLKSRLRTVMRGHKLLKDRSEEMVKQFMALIHENLRLRQELEPDIREALKDFAVSQSLMSSQEIEVAVALPSVVAEIETGYDSIMGIDVPKLQMQNIESKSLFPYAFSSTVSGLDNSITKLTALLERLVRLAQIEKTCDILASEIEKIRRRVNALEQFAIPQIREELKRIAAKLDENDRSNLVRLMKVKEYLLTDD